MPVIPGAAFTRGVVQAGEFSLEYAEAGPADASITLLSLPGSAGLEMSTAKDRLIDEYRVVEINPPGWGGKTDLDREMPQSEVGELLAEAAAALIDGPFVVLGTSMGGANALYLAVHATDRVLGIVLEGSMAPADLSDLREPPPDVDAIPKDVDAAPKEGGGYPLPPPHPNKPWATREYVAKQMADRMALLRRTRPDMDASSAVAVVCERTLPVLALLGDADEILSSSLEKTIREAIPHADFHLVPGGGHDLQNTVPDAFCALVRTFVQEVSRTHG